ncbi:CAP10 domain-containing protein [Favolaschia claudopus]|uniref:CAP10 domain-containing protein n=1 Tax=Favolaschia claudopus TaxID=2862362 RepID=A0AAW0DQQ3_9AGAR
MHTHALFSHQSRTLDQARARYELKTNRPPPPNFDKWFHWAQSKGCLIDDYDQIHRDFEPFYRIVRENPAWLRQMVGRGRNLISSGSRPGGLSNISIAGGQVFVDNDRTYFDNEWRDSLKNFAHVLPDMEILLNGNDEPRVVFNTQDPDAELYATKIQDTTPFRISPKYTSEFFKRRSGCDFVTDRQGISSNLMDVAFIRSSSSSGFTTDLWPMLSFTKITACFSDILFPSQYHYARSWYTGRIKGRDDIPWEVKAPKLYWRGSSNGGHIIGQNYRQFPRFKAVKLSESNPDLIDAKMSAFWGSHCTFDCEGRPIEEEFDIGDQHKLPREEVFKYKYVLDVDGNTFSGRYLGLLQSGSLVFKSTGFQEHFSDWLKPFEHYIPVKVDLSDLVDRVRWAIENEEEARAIQQRGMEFARNVITDEQHDCYFALVLLEWARLQNHLV